MSRLFLTSHGATDDLCDQCGENNATHYAMVKEEAIRDERGVVWHYVEVQLCNECDPEGD